MKNNTIFQFPFWFSKDERPPRRRLIIRRFTNNVIERDPFTRKYKYKCTTHCGLFKNDRRLLILNSFIFFSCRGGLSHLVSARQWCFNNAFEAWPNIDPYLLRITRICTFGKISFIYRVYVSICCKRVLSFFAHNGICEVEPWMQFCALNASDLFRSE